jgi:hypothetical protein
MMQNPQALLVVPIMDDVFQDVRVTACGNRFKKVTANSFTPICDAMRR